MKKFYAKYLALFLAGTIAFGVSGCSKEETPPEADITQTEAETPPETTKSPVLTTAFVMAQNAPEVTAKAAILVEQSTGTVLYEKNTKEKMYPASMTKMITALVAMDYFSGEELVSVGTEINEISLDSSKAGHVLGETLTVKNLIRGLIIPSGNDSANVLAVAVAREAEKDDTLNFARSEVIFTELMNQKAKELGANNTHFTNAHGYHDENHYSSAYDMALFAIAFMENETLAAIANEKSFSGNGADNMFGEGDNMKTQNYNWRSHNLLITNNEYNYGYAAGIKTGFTNEAGNCLAAAASKGEETLLTIVFDSQDPGRWIDSKNLFEYGFNGYVRHELGKKDQPVVTTQLTKHNRLEGDTLGGVFLQDVATYLPPGAEVGLSMADSYDETFRVEKKDGTIKLKGPIAKGEKIGSVSYSLNGKTVLTKEVYAERDVTKGTLWTNIKYFFKNFFRIVFSLQGAIGLLAVIVVGVGAFVLIRIFRRRNRRGYGGAYTFRTPPNGKKRRGGRRFK